MLVDRRVVARVVEHVAVAGDRLRSDRVDEQGEREKTTLLAGGLRERPVRAWPAARQLDFLLE